ncbi:MAG TPA: transglutaminase-like cysteine peptidase [Asticcacaulis sp.]|nr:transglutaminase-like cysteine peptidase [Asticcacaulis sp.]
MAFIKSSVKVSFIALFTVSAAFSAVCAGSAAAASRPAAQAVFLPAGQQISAPTAFLEMCARSPEDCQQSARPEANRPEANRIAALARQAMVKKYELAFAHLNTATPRDPMPGAVDSPQWPRLSGNRTTESGTPSTPTADYMRIDLDDSALATLKTVNTRINRSLIADTDARVYHVNDYWQAPALTRGARGDCEDFALIKRRLLIAQGIPAAALSLAIVRTRYKEEHAVLVVATKQGDFVLDNLAFKVKPWQKTDYEWISRQAPGDDLGWVSLAPARAPDMRVAYTR